MWFCSSTGYLKLGDNQVTSSDYQLSILNHAFCLCLLIVVYFVVFFRVAAFFFSSFFFLGGGCRDR